MSVIEKSEEKKQMIPITVINRILFVLVLITIFCVPVIPVTLHSIAYGILFTSIILIGTQLISKNRKLVLTYAILAIALVWIGDTMDIKILKIVSKGINIVLFIFIVIDLVKQVSRAKMVSPKVILESINSYLMIGLAFSVVVALLVGLNPGSFSFNNIDTVHIQNESSLGPYIYYAFITLTTAGYGDILPVTPVARSLSILISVTGQLYIAVVIALLVGKYISQKARLNQ